MLIALTVAVAAALAAAGSSASAPSYSFGWTGGNIIPSTVMIAADGTVTAEGPAKPGRDMLSAVQLSRVWSAVQARKFFSLRSVNCAGALPDFATEFITVRTASRTRTVRVHGDCSPRFAAVYATLKAAVALR